MNFRASFCDPFNPNVIELGDIDMNKIMETFETIAWTEFLEKMSLAKHDEIYYSPSFEVENKKNKNGLTISAIDGTEWYLFFKRPKLVRKRKWFRSSEVMEPNYLSDLTGQSLDDVKLCLLALMKDDLKFLEEKFS